ncbi:MAG: hypothetical protein LBM70_02340 [Victivallales bacterium]|jgi:hypothetical protein|nr:hypothetical protein [Victivallales bacterium]
MKHFYLIATAVLCMAAGVVYGESASEQVIFADDFTKPAEFGKYWDYRSPTQPLDGILEIGQNDFRPRLKSSIDGKENVTVKAEISNLGNTGFVGLNIDGIMFFVRDGSAVAVFKSPEKSYTDSKMKKIPDYKDGEFYKFEITRTKVGDDFEYLYKINGNEMCVVKGQKIPPTNKIMFTSYKTGMKAKSFAITEPATVTDAAAPKAE